MNPRTAVAHTLVACGLFAGLVAQDLQKRLPNIVYVLADDLGYGDLGCYGQQQIRTPHLDAMARDGMRFVQHYSGAPVCAPSRCVLLTGKHSGHATIRDNQEHQPEGQKPIAPDDVTLAEVLKARGYVTGCFGKWGLGYPGSDGDPRRRGFDRFYGYNCQRHAHNFYPTYLWDDDERRELVGNSNGATGAHYSADVITDAAVAFVEANAARPFFLYVPMTLPHLALQVPEASLAAYRGQWEETPYTGTSYQPHPTPRACYAAMVTHLDALVGRLLGALDQQGLREHTIVFFSSDNGPTHLPAQVDVEFFGSAGGLRGLKGSVDEGGIRVPLLVRWPLQVAAGSRTDHVCAFQDVMPTLCEVAGAATPLATDGISFVPTLRGAVAQQRQHEALLWDFPGYGGQLAVREGKWKGVRRKLRQHPGAPLELYDLEADRAETTDVAAANAEVVARLLARMVAMRTEPVDAALRFGDYATGAVKTDAAERAGR